MSIPAAKLLNENTHIVPGKLKITEYLFEVPRDYSNPGAGTLRIFARGARKSEKPLIPEDGEDPKKKQLPWLLYLQGGPGLGCGSPEQYPWTRYMLEKGYAMLYMDQRGTGLSSPITTSTLGLRGDDAVQVEYLKSFRADNIVRDAEAIRQTLTADYPEDKRKWSIIGQSFGGFCSVTYLSSYPDSLRESFILGGLPPLVDRPDTVYARLFRKMLQRNEAYYAKYPEDIARVKSIVAFLRRHGDESVRLPSGGVLTPRRFLAMGVNFGFHGGLDNVHRLVLRAANDLATVGHLTRKTTGPLERTNPYEENILYALIHEPCYCQGRKAAWAAERILHSIPEFGIDAPLADPGKKPLLFTGEVVLTSTYASSAELKPLQNVASMLAQESDWPLLYDVEQLGENKVPVYAAVYVDDLYVDFDFSMQTARTIKGCKTWITNAVYHDGIQAKCDEVLGALWALRDDTID